MADNKIKPGIPMAEQNMMELDYGKIVTIRQNKLYNIINLLILMFLKKMMFAGEHFK